MTLIEFTELHKEDELFSNSIDIEVAIASLTCNGRINLDKIIQKHNKIKEKSTIGKLKKEIKNEIRNNMFSFN